MSPVNRAAGLGFRDLASPLFSGCLENADLENTDLESLPFDSEFSVILVRIQMEQFIPVGCFRKKVTPFEVFPFSRFYRNSRKFLYHLSALTVSGSSR